MVKITFNKELPKKRIAVIDRDLCTKEKCGYICMKVCPVNKVGKECITVDEEGYPVISEELCIGCGICVSKCPVDAITIVNLSLDFDRVIHSYGPNSFRLYSLALPKEGELVGFLGKNGIGKTTTIKILAKKLVPNFGKGITTWEEALKEMTIEERAFFQKERTLSLKPQYIESMRQPITVEEFLKMLKLELPQFEHLKERKLSELSGGELQKLALEVALAKEADLYYIDEPTNFLDIGERLRYALEIRERLEGKDVVVVDHDLAFIDYVVDYVYLFVGEEDTYGFASNIRPVRNGINEYLEGYLKTENFRFREFPIKFDHYSESETGGEIAFSYPSFTKTYPGFKLEAEGSEIREEEVIGIVGKNGIGKSTFLKVIAGVEPSDQGKLHSLKVSYKPQYIPLYKERAKEWGIPGWILEGLKIRQALLEKPFEKLSGGQMQKLAIARALSQEADLYVLDEPTAYLDIENRVILAKFLKDFALRKKVPLMVIDHDIVFIDKIASRLIVFEGEPGKHGRASPALDKEEGMNAFLKAVDITMRRDKDTKRPRINKKGSVLDREQREKGKYYNING
ncbi:MAG: ribosome biogenesis/translation initiation ATPase RLI [Candidatus Micrarchaeota archaeon]|nr:ribosome biogenesis/translation initiation ATPase RLI [Candidatus Micrarchaeota archaeon]